MGETAFFIEAGVGWWVNRGRSTIYIYLGVEIFRG